MSSSPLVSFGSQADIDSTWTGSRFAALFPQQIQPTLAILLIGLGLASAGKYSVTRRSLQTELSYAALSSLALGLGIVLGLQALGLHL